MLCTLPNEQRSWLASIFHGRDSDYTFRLSNRDEAGMRFLGELKDRGIANVANALGQSRDHVLSFFTSLRTELAFYLGCVNLHGQLEQNGYPICFPTPISVGSHNHTGVELRDVCLILTLGRDVVGNDLRASGKNLVVITGANQGGKSTFLRAIGLAQLMMQAGMFVIAESFTAEVCDGLFTHFKREEDATMKSGKFDEELGRMSGLVQELRPNSLLLCNESFAATNDREGSEIARQIVRALIETGVKMFFVTHLYDFARSIWEEKIDSALFLRAERQSDGRRTFKLPPGEPMQTSFGVDLYEEIFNDPAENTESR